MKASLRIFLVLCLFPWSLHASLTKPISVYIQQSTQGSLEQDSSFEYTLTLEGNSLNLVYFTDQPHRKTGQKNLPQYLEAWKKNKKFHKNPPTAFINFNSFQTTKADGVAPDILMLQDPQYDEESDTLTFKVQPLHDRPMQLGKLKNVVIIYDLDD